MSDDAQWLFFYKKYCKCPVLHDIIHTMENEKLYINVKQNICDGIYRGIYKDGDKIPPERTLSDNLKVSRVTVRKALEIMEQGRLIVREVGSGTRVQLHNYGWARELEILVLVAPAGHAQFSVFIEQFQRCAAAGGSLLLYLERLKKDTIEDCLYRLYQRGLCDVAVWPHGISLEQEKLERLRALGMNMVFFDTDTGFPFGDCVYSDIEAGMEAMCSSVRKKKNRRLGYIGLDTNQSYSARQAKEAFMKVGAPGKVLFELPQKRENHAQIIKKELERLERKGKLPDAIICPDGKDAVLLAKRLLKMKAANIKVASFEELADSARFGITTYEKDFREIAKTLYECLSGQSRKGELWKAKRYLVSGSLTER